MAIVLILRESLNNKSGLGFCVLTLLQSKESSKKKIEENNPTLKFNVTLKNVCDKTFWAI